MLISDLLSGFIEDVDAYDIFKDPETYPIQIQIRLLHYLMCKLSDLSSADQAIMLRTMKADLQKFITILRHHLMDLNTISSSTEQIIDHIISNQASQPTPESPIQKNNLLLNLIGITNLL